MSNYIYEYYQKITDGSIVAGRYIKLLYGKIIEGLEDKSFFFSPKKAERAIRCIEMFTHHSKGRFAPGRVKLELWQKALLSCVFGIVDEAGRRQFREVLVCMGRKCGKSILASGVAQYMAYADGENGADCFFLAPKIDQADIVFDDFLRSVEAEPELDAITKKRRTDLYIQSTNTSIKKIPFSSKKSDGYSPHCCIMDELAAWVGDQGVKQYNVMTSALGAREQPLIFSITTANYVNDGIYDELFKRSTAYLQGNSAERRLLPFLYVIDDLSKWNDINELQKSLPNLGVSVSVDYILDEIAKAETSLSARAEFITKYACRKQNSSIAWLDAGTVEQCCGDALTPEMFRRSYCVGGVDLAKTTDLCSACVVVEKDGRLHVMSHFWLPSERLEAATAEDGIPYLQLVQRGWCSLSGENQVDYRDVFSWFRDLVEQYRILPLQIGYDRYSAAYLVQEMKEYGFHMDDVFQGWNLSPVIDECESIMRDGAINIGDNQLLKMHLLNTAVKTDVESARRKIVKITSRDRIDGCAALLDALTVRQKWHGEIGRQLKNER